MIHGSRLVHTVASRVASTVLTICLCASTAGSTLHAQPQPGDSSRGMRSAGRLAVRVGELEIRRAPRLHDGIPIDGGRRVDLLRRGALVHSWVHGPQLAPARAECSEAMLSSDLGAATPGADLGALRGAELEGALDAALQRYYAPPGSAPEDRPLARRVGSPTLCWTRDARRGEFVLAWRTGVLVERRGLQGERWLDVEATTGRVIGDRRGRRGAEISGTVEGRLPDLGQPFGTFISFVDVPLPSLSLLPAGLPEAVTDTGGLYLFDSPTDTIFATAGLDGPFFTVLNGGGVDSTFLGLLSATGPNDILFNESPTEFGTAEVSAFAVVARCRAFLDAIVPDFGPAQVPLNINVNLDGACFAFYSPIFQSLNFSRAGAGCPNTAYGTVVAHEYYHHILSTLGPGDEAYDEAMSDAFAAYVFDSPLIGPGYYGTGSALRDLSSGALFPAPPSGDPADVGLPLASAFWDLRVELASSLGDVAGPTVAADLWLTSQLVGDGTISPTVILDLLLIDDDDGDLGNGTPHQAEIIAAFTGHGFPAPLLPVEGLICTVLENRVQLDWSDPEGVSYDVVRIYRDGVQIAGVTTGETTFTDLFPEPGPHSYGVEGAQGASTAPVASCDVEVPTYSAFVRGDVNGDGSVELADGVVLLGVLFLGGVGSSCEDAGDIDDDGVRALDDAVQLLQFLFIGGPAPAEPYPSPGFDPTPDDLACP